MFFLSFPVLFSISGTFFLYFVKREQKKSILRLPQITHPCHRTTVTQIVLVTLISVCLPFKTNAVICLLHMEAALHQPHEELNHIPQVEQRVGQLPLLTSVDELMVQFMRFHLPPPTLHKDASKKVESVVGAKGDETVIDDFHGGKVSDFFSKLEFFYDV